MTNFLVTILLFGSILFSSCRQKQSCDQLPDRYSTYDEAVKKIESSNFEIKEEANTEKSSWIKGASFYSCDGKLGYFILQMDKKDYLYSDIPYSLWKEFKNAESFGKVYNEKIKDRFTFQWSR